MVEHSKIETPVTDPEKKSDPQPHQAHVYRWYIHLQAMAAERFHHPAPDNLAGRLVLCSGFGRQGAEMALATTIAGGAFLGVDPSAENLKAAVRNGSCDFMVNTLDESLRVLKNELRKQTPLAVGLLGSPADIFPDIIERGLQPDLMADNSPQEGDTLAAFPRQAMLQLMERGAAVIDKQPAKPSQEFPLLQIVWTTGEMADSKTLDAIALALLPPQDQVRRRWLHQASVCFRRQLPLQRVLGLHPDQITRLLSAFQEAAASGKIHAVASVQWQSPDGVEQQITLQPC